MSRSTPFIPFAIVLSAAIGCSSSTENPETVNDSGVTADTSTKPDTGVSADSGPTSCAVDLPSDYACPDFRPAKAASTCNEAALEDFVAKCIKADYSVPSGCADWKTANAGCNTCIEDWSYDKGKVYPGHFKCYDLLSPGCGNSLTCDYDCAANVCENCDLMSSEFDDCAVAAMKSDGRCYTIASQKAQACRADPKNKVCEVSQYLMRSPDETKLRAELLHLLRGACRDNGDWTNADAGS